MTNNVNLYLFFYFSLPFIKYHNEYHFGTKHMNFERLPIEILFNLFDYFRIYHLFQLFYNLNSRFNTILFDYSRKSHLDFQSISKTNFDLLCQNYLPLFSNQIHSLRLSDDDETPQQTILFLSYGFHLHQFVHLQSITLSNFHSSYILDKLLTECSDLPCLTYFKLHDCHLSIDRNHASNLYNRIWNLPKLVHCYLDIHFSNGNYFPRPTCVSQSLEYLSFLNLSCYSKELIDLFQSTPNLRSLIADFMDYDEHFDLTFPMRSITRLKLSFDGSLIILENLLQKLPDLSHLTLEIINNYMNGYQWQDLIERNLRKLKRFEFKMRFSPSTNDNKDEQSNEILSSFQTKFWLDEHQWFVRCHWYSSDDHYQLDFIDLFTLPYAFQKFLSHTRCTLVKSTCLSNDDFWTYDRVRHLCYGSTHFINSILSQVRFSNIKHLSLSLPFNELFFSIVTQLERLTSLKLSINSKKNLESIPSQLQTLLHRTTRLHSLSFSTWSIDYLSILFANNFDRSIRHLNLKNFTCGKTCRYFNDEQCEQISRSKLGKQCQLLSIKLEHRHQIVYLVNRMSQLRTLNVRCQDDSWTNNELLSTQDELIHWLRDYLPSSCVVTRENLSIRIWIR